MRRTGGPAIQRILARHGIKATTKEGGRTSRGTVAFMKSYVELLNRLQAKAEREPGVSADQLLDIAERFWVARMAEKLAEKPLRLPMDGSRGIRHVIRDLIDQARERSRVAGGAHIHGTVLQHIVGAKLELALGPRAAAAGLTHNNSNKKDDELARHGDFKVSDAVIHVTVTPSLGVVEKCRDNLTHGLRPIVSTTADGVLRGDTLVEELGLAGRVDVLDVEQFVATNVYEISDFDSSKRTITLKALADQYNRIVMEAEGDVSLTIKLT